MKNLQDLDLETNPQKIFVERMKEIDSTLIVRTKSITVQEMKTLLMIMDIDLALDLDLVAEKEIAKEIVTNLLVDLSLVTEKEDGKEILMLIDLEKKMIVKKVPLALVVEKSREMEGMKENHKIGVDMLMDKIEKERDLEGRSVLDNAIIRAMDLELG